MTLTTHAVAGALIGIVAQHNIPFAVVAALISHPLLDTIPHWDYALSSGKMDEKNPMNNDMKIGGKKFFIDLLKIGFDFWLGIVIVSCVLLYVHASTYVSVITLLCALIAIAPDPLQFIYWKSRSKIIAPFQRFHMYMHAKTKLNEQPIFGVLSQAVIIVCIIVLIKNLV